MYETMIFLTLDRFFSIFLNIKYPLFWTYSKTIKLVIGAWIFNLLMLVAFWLNRVSLTVLNTYLYVIFDILFLVTSIGTYTYIIAMIRKKQKVCNLELTNNTLIAPYNLRDHTLI